MESFLKNDVTLLIVRRARARGTRDEILHAHKEIANELVALSRCGVTVGNYPPVKIAPLCEIRPR